MCGIFGIAVTERSRFSPEELARALVRLQLLSESRGKEAAGLAVQSGDRIEVLKSALPASAMVRTPGYKELFRRSLAARNGASTAAPLAIIGHSRLVTTGTQYDPDNNQPVIAGGSVGVHNGIIVNHEEIWSRYPELERRSENDSEVAFRLVRRFHEKTGSLIEATRRAFEQIEGATSIAVLFEDVDRLLLASNNGSLYRCTSEAGGALIFASERYILEQLLRRRGVRESMGELRIEHVAPGRGAIVDTADLGVEEFDLGQAAAAGEATPRSESPRRIVELRGIEEKATALTRAHARVGLSGPVDEGTAEHLAQIGRRFPYDTSWQDGLRRCSRCILPETMPFIEVDGEGVCNYCRSYRKLDFEGADALAEVARRIRTPAGEPDCVVGVSGGRDSLYSLHYVKRVLGLDPVAYTYDWGMVTDLARRNISRICGKLGVEHILVSADIVTKRKFIRKNVAAWLDRPVLGMVPLFMAGDKQYFLHLARVKKQLGVDLAILSENMLERTDFKTGFAGVPPHQDSRHVYTLPVTSNLKHLLFYARQYLGNPAYLNTSLADTLHAYGSYYLLRRDYLNLFNYVPWIEDEVVSTVLDDYDFELAPDTNTTWRIGDGTASFYNYIYYTMAGFTENETFRSNQIREGLITRDEALRRVREENKPRYETIQWYLDIIDLGIGMEKVLQTIHDAPRVGRNPRWQR